MSLNNACTIVWNDHKTCSLQICRCTSTYYRKDHTCSRHRSVLPNVAFRCTHILKLLLVLYKKKILSALKRTETFLVIVLFLLFTFTCLMQHKGPLYVALWMSKTQTVHFFVVSFFIFKEHLKTHRTKQKNSNKQKKHNYFFNKWLKIHSQICQMPNLQRALKPTDVQVREQFGWCANLVKKNVMQYQ